MSYVGRFAPSPTGLLHAGSLVAALASWLDARTHGGRWLVRIENVDTPRCIADADATILAQLDALGLVPDAPPTWQSRRGDRYEDALAQLRRSGWAYACTCSRSDIAAALARAGVAHVAHVERVYPGTCCPPTFASTELAAGDADGPPGRPPAWRLRTRTPAGEDIVVDWHDRLLGDQRQDVTRTVGDFVLKRADGLWAYQLAVVVDDAAQGITAVVRGEDLADNTARQIHLQRTLGLPTPRYLHTPLVRADDGQKLSKQTGARPLTLRSDVDAVAALRRAARVLGLPAALHDGSDLCETPARWLARAVPAWADKLRAVGGMIPPSATPPASPSLLNQRQTRMTTTPSGLQYEDTVVGSGPVATSGQSVTVHYTGWLADPAAANGRGKKFDSSKDRGQPFVFGLDQGMVIKGWDEGVQGMAAGGTRVLTIPAELGYGARGAGGVIPPNATLVFEVDLISSK